MNVSESMHKCVITTDNFEVKERVMIVHNFVSFGSFCTLYVLSCHKILHTMLCVKSQSIFLLACITLLKRVNG